MVSRQAHIVSASERQAAFEADLAKASERREERRPRGFGRRSTKRSLGQGKAISPATAEQKALVQDRACIVCGKQPCDPAHLIDRSLAPAAGDDPRAVVPLCRAECHRAYDEGKLDLSSYLEPYWREAIAWAVETMGLFPTLRRITNKRWVPEETS
jgi:hypothetical protein